MAVSWGSEVRSSGGGRYRIGVNVWERTRSGSRVQYHGEIHFQVIVGSATDSSNTLRVTGPNTNISTSWAVNLRSPGTVMYEWEFAVDQAYGSSYTYSVNASFAGVATFPTMYASTSFTCYGTSYQPPVKPAWSAIVKNSDRQFDLRMNLPSDDLHPVSGLEIAKQVDEQPWVTVYLGPAGHQWIDNNVEPNHRYQYWYRLTGPGGTGSWSDSWELFTTPAAPLAPYPEKTSPTTVHVTWEARAPYVQASEIEDTSAGGTWTVNGTASQWDHTGASTTATHTYRVRTKMGGLWSAWSEPSFPLSLPSAPAAPTDLTPGGLNQPYVPTGSTAVLTWKHNPTDGSPQTSFQVRVRRSGYTTWTTMSRVYNSTASYTLSSSYVNWSEFEWQVCTWGQDSTKQGAWSSVALVRAVPRPTVTLSGIPSTVTQGEATATYSFTNSSNNSYTLSWRLVTGSTTVTSSNTTVLGVGNTGDIRLSGLENGKSYTLYVTVVDRVESFQAARSFTVKYAAPEKPVLTPTWDPSTGVLQLYVRNPSGTVNATRNEVWVMEGGDGAGYKRVLDENMAPNTSLWDTWILPRGLSQYYVRAWASNGTYSESSVVVDTRMRPLQAVTLSTESNTVLCQVRWNPEVSYAPELLVNEVVHFAGRTLPVMLAGTQRTFQIDLSGDILASDVLLEGRRSDIRAAGDGLEPWMSAAYWGRPLLYRDPLGTCKWVAASGVKLDRNRETGGWSVSCTLQEVGR